jgi:hypothetical protein
MKHRFKLFLLGLLVLMAACGNPQPSTTDGTWDSSQWDSTAVWK